MTEIEKCVCGGEAFLVAGWVVCKACGREGTAGEAAIAAWNHDQRGLRLLRELGECDYTKGLTLRYPSGVVDLLNVDVPEDLWHRVLDWAKEGDR